VEHVFAAQKRRLGLVVRSVGLARVTTRLGLANLVTNMRRLAWFERGWCRRDLTSLARAMARRRTGEPERACTPRPRTLVQP